MSLALFELQSHSTDPADDGETANHVSRIGSLVVPKDEELDRSVVTTVRPELRRYRLAALTKTKTTLEFGDLGDGQVRRPQAMFSQMGVAGTIDVVDYGTRADFVVDPGHAQRLLGVRFESAQLANEGVDETIPSDEVLIAVASDGRFVSVAYPKIMGVVADRATRDGDAELDRG